MFNAVILIIRRAAVALALASLFGCVPVCMVIGEPTILLP